MGIPFLALASTATDNQPIRKRNSQVRAHSPDPRRHGEGKRGRQRGGEDEGGQADPEEAEEQAGEQRQGDGAQDEGGEEGEGQEGEEGLGEEEGLYIYMCVCQVSQR